MGLQPDGPVEEHLIRELATLSARLQRLEAAEYAFIAGNIEADPSDCRELATAFEKVSPQLDQLHKAELHLRRAYNRTWDRLERMQKDRHKLPLDDSLKRSERWLTYYREKEKPASPDQPTGTATTPTSNLVRSEKCEPHPGAPTTLAPNLQNTIEPIEQ